MTPQQMAAFVRPHAEHIEVATQAKSPIRGVPNPAQSPHWETVACR